MSRATGLRRVLQYPGSLFALQIVAEVASAIAGVGIFWAIWSWAMRLRQSVPIDRETCTCSCWDAVYRDGHGRGSEYKSVYFNVDEYTGPIFMVGTAGAVILNAAVRAVAGILWRRRMRWLPFIALCACIYPIFYGLWAAVNYLNDRYFPMWNGQFYFTITELIVSLALLILCNGDIPVAPGTVWTVVVFAGAHAARSPFDQFLKAATGVLVMLAADIFVVTVVLIVLAREALRSDRQGWAWTLLSISQRGAANSAARDLPAGRVSADAAVAMECDEEQTGKREGNSDSISTIAASHSLVPPVPAFSEAVPKYTRRWAAADAVIVSALIVLQVIMIKIWL